MISIINLSKNYGKKTLFKNVSLTINRGEKIGLLGPNGAGKSTLFSMILAETEPSAGSINVNKNIRIGYLPQESSFKSNRTVLNELTEGDELIKRLRKEKEALESKNEAGSLRYGEVLHELEVRGYFELEYKAKKVLSGLGFLERDFSRSITEMSGGWQMRVLLAKLLTFQYDILLLDEPTNYLDLNAALWFKDYLSGFSGTFIMISHDKAFLNEVTNYTLVLENGGIFKVEGSYEHYERIKEEKRKHLFKQFKEQQKKRKQLENFVARFHAQPNKAQSVRAKRTVLEKMEEIVIPSDIRESIRGFHFPQASRSGLKVMTLNKISKSYGEIEVYKDFCFEIEQGEKAVLAGENGAGKSTLLKIIAGVIGIDAGERIVGHRVDIGYFSQTRMDVLNPDNTVLQEAYSAAVGYSSQETIRTILGAFLFGGDDVDKRVKVLSGGEKSRLILAKLLINPPNFLLLDEPTTHLDVDAVDALIEALNQYTGTIIFISHDIHFVRAVANVVFEVKKGRVKKIPGNFDYYLEKKSKGQIYEEVSVGRESTEDSVAKSYLLEAEKKLREEEKEKERKAHNARIKAEILKLRKEKEKLKLEKYTKTRVLSGPRRYQRDESLIREYEARIRELSCLIPEIENKIKNFKTMFK